MKVTINLLQEQKSPDLKTCRFYLVQKKETKQFNMMFCGVKDQVYFFIPAQGNGSEPYYGTVLYARSEYTIIKEITQYMEISFDETKERKP